MSAYPDEKRLIQQLLSGQKTAWREFVLKYQGLVLSRVKRTAELSRFQLDISDCEDVCAEVFSGLLANEMSSLRSFRGASSLATWLSVISRRTCLRYIDRLPRERARALDLDEANETLSRSADARNEIDRLIAHEQRELVHDAMKKLSTDDRRILCMYFMDQLTYGEISNQLGISVNTVGPKLSRARDRIRKLLAKQ